MKILHTADWHIGDFKGPVLNGENLRRKDIYNCLDFLYETAVAEKPDLIVISGDIFHVAKVWAERGFSEVSYSIRFLRKLSKLSKVCLLRGTPNHDGKEQFNMIKMALLENENVIIFDTEDVKKISTDRGDICVAGIPGFDKIYYRNQQELKFENDDEFFSKKIEETILDLKARCDKNLPNILLLHHTVSGCMTENGKILDLRKLDIVVDTKSLKKADFDMVLLGHIHRPQKLKNCKNTFYSGAVNGLTFGDEGQDRGFYIHELQDKNPNTVNSRFIITPSRRFFTLRLDNTDIENFISDGNLKLLDSTIRINIKDSIVRVVYSCSSENNASLNKSLLEKVLYSLKAFYVQEIIPENITQNIDRDSLFESNTPTKNLEEYLAEMDLEDSFIDKSIEIATPIIDKYVQNTQTTAMKGVFMPIEIEVDNYRSYKYQKFSYENINFTTINGENGSGKSSLFMDAILDALYDETREGTGSDASWVSNRDEVKQGKISFIFNIGDRRFRIIRIRKKKSAKAKKKPTPNLELYEWINDDWENIGKNKNRDTQEEINEIVGMDSGLLCSCGLIMQDKYGLFLESDKKDRMNTLCNILGLGIYDKLYADVSENVKSLKRDIAELKDEELRYNQNDLLKRDINSELDVVRKKQDSFKKTEKSYNESLEKLNQIVAEREKSLDTKENLDERIIEKNQTIISLQKLSEKLELQETTLKNDIEALKKEITKADSLIKKEVEVKLNIDIYNKLRNENKNLSEKQVRLNTLQEREAERENDLENRESEYKKIDQEIEIKEKEIETMPTKISKISILKKQNDKYEALIKQKEILEEKKEKHNILEKNIANKKNEKITSVAGLEKKTNNAKVKLDKAKEKSELLEKTDCPLKEKANCSFLKDAIASKKQLSKLEQEYKSAEQEKTLLEKKFDEELRKLELQKKTLDFSEDLKQISIQISDLEKDVEEYKNIISLQKDYDRISKELIEKKEDLLDKKSKVEEAKNNLQEINSKIKQLKDIPEQLKENQKQIDIYIKYDDELSRINEAKINKKNDEKNIRDKQKLIQGSEKEIKENNKLREKAKKEIEKLEKELNTIKEKIQSADEKIEKYSKPIIDNNLFNTKLDPQNNSADIKLDPQNNPADIKLDPQNNSADIKLYPQNNSDSIKLELQNKLDSIKSELEQLSKEIGKLEVESESQQVLQKDLANLKTSLNEKSKNYAVYEKLKKAFSKDGILHSIIRRTIPNLEELSNNILQGMSGQMMRIEFVTDKLVASKGEEVPTLDIIIDDSQNGRLPYVSKSGGERVKIALSIILALAEMKTSAFGVQLGFLFIDEPPFLDEQGVEVYCDALESIKKRYDNLKIIAITHDQTMQSRFIEKIEVRKTDEGSKLFM